MQRGNLRPRLDGADHGLVERAREAALPVHRVARRRVGVLAPLAAHVGADVAGRELLDAGEGGARREVIMVSSGAIAEGMKRLGWAARPREVHELQAAAAVGQMGLVQMYETRLREHGMESAQILLTHADLADRERYLNARSTLVTLLSLKVIPVINENDTVVTESAACGAVEVTPIDDPAVAVVERRRRLLSIAAVPPLTA